MPSAARLGHSGGEWPSSGYRTRGLVRAEIAWRRQPSTHSLVGGDIRAGGNAAAESMCLGHDRPQLFRARQSALTCETYFDQVRS